MRAYLHIGSEESERHLERCPDDAELAFTFHHPDVLRSGGKFLGMRRHADGKLRFMVEVPSDPTSMLL